MGTVQSHPGQLVDTAVRRTRIRVAQEYWSTPRDLGPKPEWRGTLGRPRRPSDLSPSSPEHFVDHVGPRTWAGVTRDPLVDTVGPWTRARVALDRWSTPRALRYGPESPGAPGQPRGTSGMGASLPGQLLDRGPSDANASHPGELVDTAGPKAWA